MFQTISEVTAVVSVHRFVCLKEARCVLCEVRSVSCIMYSVFISVLCREVITVYCENRVELTNAMCGQSAEF